MDSAAAQERTGATAQIAAEQAVLGAVLADNAMWPKLSIIVEQEHFTESVHADIWRLMGESMAAGIPVSALTLRPQLAEHEGLAQIGGVAYLARLYGAVVEPRGAVAIARQMREGWVRRSAAEAATEAAIELRGDVERPTREIIEGLEGMLLGLGESIHDGPRDGWVTGALKEATDDLWEAYHSGVPRMGVTSGLKDLDAITGGWKPGQLTILGGRPGMGKTALMLFMAWSAARAGHGVHFASLEMMPREISYRLIALEAWASHRSRASYRDIQRGELTDQQAEAVARAAAALADMPIRISDPSMRGLGALAASARRSQQVMGQKNASLDLVLIDYLGLIHPPRQRQGKVQEIGDVVGGLKSLSMSLEAPIVCGSQLSRRCEERNDKRPVLSDLRDSGDIEQDADQVIFPYRHAYYLERERDSAPDPVAWLAEMDECANVMEIDVGKNRHGATGRCKAFCRIELNVLGDMT